MKYRSTWNKSEPRSLARVVPPDLGESQLELPQSAVDLINRPNGRAELTQALYEAFASAGIQYALEAWNPDERVQTVRTAAEILAGPKKGTCLDLSVLFAAQCLSVHLLPIIVVTGSHAFVLVSLEVGADGIDAYSRTQSELFTNGELTDCDVLASLVDDSAYVAVETTGFAHVTSLDTGSVLGRGRQDGLLPFEQAKSTGRLHLEHTTADPIEFALDIAWAHSMGIVPQAIFLENPLPVSAFTAGHTEYGLQLDRDHSRSWGERRPDAPIRRTNIIGRSKAKEVLQRIAPGELVGVQGALGMGKSALLRWLGNEPGGDLAGATVMLRYETGGVLDMVQEVYERCFVSDRRLSLADASEVLGPLPGRLLIDDMDSLGHSEVEDLRNLLAGWGIAVAAVDPSVTAIGTIRAVKALEPTEAFQLFESQAGVVPQDRRTELWQSFLGLAVGPGGVIEVANGVITGALSLDGVASALSSTVASGAVGASGIPAGEVATLLQAAAPAFVPLQILHEVTTSTGRAIVAAELTELVDRQLARSGSPRYRWIGPVVPSRNSENILIDAVLSWAGDRNTIPDQIAAERGLVLRTMELAAANGRHSDVLRLARLSDGPIASSRRWGAWGKMLGQAQLAAAELSDDSELAWVQHQLGSRALGLGDADQARDRLRWARDTRRRLGQGAAAAASQHNLDLLPPLGPSPDSEPDPEPPQPTEPSQPTTVQTPDVSPPPKPPKLSWIRRHPWWSGIFGSLALVIAIVAIANIACANGRCEPDRPSDSAAGGDDTVEDDGDDGDQDLPEENGDPSTPTPTPTPTPNVPVEFRCALSADVVDLGELVGVTVDVSPRDDALTVTAQDESGTVREVTPGADATFSYSNAGTHEIVVRWTLGSLSDEASCGVVQVVRGVAPPIVEPNPIECVRSPQGPLGVRDPFLLTVSWEPADLDLEIEFDHGDGTIEAADEDHRADGYYLEQKSFQPTATWFNGTRSGTINCGGLVTVVSENTEPTLRPQCDVDPTELEPGRQFQFVISTSYEPASLRTQVTVNHGDGTVEAVDVNGEASGWYQDDGVYTPSASFVTENQRVTINCGKVFVGTVRGPVPDVFECAVSTSVVSPGEKVDLEVTLDQGDGEFEVEYRASIDSEYTTVGTVSYETVGKYAPVARWLGTEGPGEVVSCGTVSVVSDVTTTPSCVNFDDRPVTKIYDKGEFGTGVSEFTSGDASLSVVGLFNSEQEVLDYTQILETTFPNGPGNKLWLFNAGVHIDLPPADGWTMLFRQTTGPVNLVINGEQELVAFPNFGSIEPNLGEYVVSAKGGDGTPDGVLTILGNDITSIRIGGGGLGIDDICPVVPS